MGIKHLWVQPEFNLCQEHYRYAQNDKQPGREIRIMIEINSYIMKVFYGP